MKNYLILIFILSGITGLQAQSFLKITVVSTHYETSTNNTSYTATGTVAASGSYTMKFGTASGLWTDHIQVLDAANASSGACFQQIPSSINQIVKLKRVNNTFITGTTSCIWMEGSTPSATGGACANRLPYEDVMDTVFSSGWFNAGTDNLFNNTVTSNNNNNIERFDVILSSGYVITDATNEGIILFERGADGAHDRLKIAGVSAIDASNNPSAYKTGPVSINTVDWGDIGSSSVSYTVLRKDLGDTKLRPSNKSASQNRGGIFVPFGKLGFSAGQTVYGYSLMGFDVTATTAAQVLNYSNATLFPITTQDVNGGVDLIGVTYFYQVVNTCGIMLPVELKSFNGEAAGAVNKLTWTTASESDDRNFEIEYSTDGNNFIKAGEVLNQGASAFENSYEFIHSPVTSEVTYYRLKQTHADNTADLSETITVQNELPQQAITFYPNPLKENTALLISGLTKDDYILQIYSLQGDLITEHTFTAENGYLTINSPALHTGQYLIRLTSRQTGQRTPGKLYVQ